ncbi:endonuclease/exonuclease/phosphatase family protein [Brucella abortus]|nr:endonuclease/exonuclease/phosphatase family protein [Brucella abortus]
MKIATWNINSVKARIDNLQHWLRESSPDIVCLQEIKSVDEQFPALRSKHSGYHVETHGQKGFNGVALLSKNHRMRSIKAFPVTIATNRPVSSKAFIRPILVSCGSCRSICPTSNPIDTEKFPYKLSWMQRLENWAKKRLQHWKNHWFWRGDS